MKKKVIMIDPPSGWKYGFPKVLPEDRDMNTFNTKKWLVENGYPQREIDSCGDYFYCRYWEREEFKCPIGVEDCWENCGRYACGN